MFCWDILGIHVHANLSSRTHPHYFSWQWYPQWDNAFCHTAKISQELAMGCYTVNMASEIPRSLSDWAFVGFTEATSQPPRLKASTTNILVPDSTGHPQKSWVHASTCHSCLMKWEELSQYQSGGFNVVADWCVIVRNAWNWVRPSREQGSQKTLSYLPSP